MTPTPDPDLRQRIEEDVIQHPNTSYGQVARRLQVNPRRALAHLQNLARTGTLTTTCPAGTVLYRWPE